MRYDQDLVDKMLEIDRKSGIPPEETLTRLALYYGRQEEWQTALKERRHGGFFRSNGKDLVVLHAEICEDTADEKLLLDEKTPGFWRRTPDRWIEYERKLDDGRVIASCGELYAGFKLLRRMYEHGTAEQQKKSQRYLDRLRKDFHWNEDRGGLTASTRLFYSGNSLDARIAHHYRCKMPELTTERTIEVPVYRGTPVEKIVGEENGLTYLQAFLDTQDDGETIIQSMEFVSGKTRANIFVWTANTTPSNTAITRSSRPERAAWFGCDGDDLNLLGNDYLNGDSAARGVRLAPR